MGVKLFLYNNRPLTYSGINAVLGKKVLDMSVDAIYEADWFEATVINNNDVTVTFSYEIDLFNSNGLNNTIQGDGTVAPYGETIISGSVSEGSMDGYQGGFTFHATGYDDLTYQIDG